MGTGHTWSFYTTGGVSQVVLRSGADLAHLDELDKKLWIALAMPTRGIQFSARTLDLIDLDGDGRIRPPEILAALRWAKTIFADLGELIEGGDHLPLSAIRDPQILASAKRILTALGKPDADNITLADVSSQEKLFANTRFNGDGVIPAASAEDETVRQAIVDILSVIEPVKDRNGQPGINQSDLNLFFTKAAALIQWAAEAESDPSIAPLSLADTASALGAIDAILEKIDDYFARCRLAEFDSRATSALNHQESEFQLLADKMLNVDSTEIAAFPLARVEAGKALPLQAGLNPAWLSAMEQLKQAALRPLLGTELTELREEDWQQVKERIKPFRRWTQAKPDGSVEGLGLDRLKELLSGPFKEEIARLIRQDAAFEPDYAQVVSVEKMLRFKRDFYSLLSNFVNFSEFYGRRTSIFQAGSLYLDARTCHLCVEVTDVAKHVALAGKAGAFLAYCECTRKDGQKKTIAAVFTDGDSDNLMVGRNGVFYDRDGKDWDATITQIVANAISVREAFWMPYKKLIRFIEEQIAKRAQTADQGAHTKMSDAATALTSAGQTSAAAPTLATPKKLDLGTIALIGVAIGGISSLVAGFLQAIFGLGFWLPLGVLGILLLISGPSMFLAWLKLRKRNLGPILDANGWAINTRAYLNGPFGAAMTELADLPEGARRELSDPYGEKKRPWKSILATLLIATLGICWGFGLFDNYLPDSLQMRTSPPAAAEDPVAPPQAPAE